MNSPAPRGLVPRAGKHGEQNVFPHLPSRLRGRGVPKVEVKGARMGNGGGGSEFGPID